MKRLFYTLLMLLFVVMLNIIGCSPKVHNLPYAKTYSVNLADPGSSSQTAGGITVELKPLDLKMEYEKSVYKQKLMIATKFGSTITYEYKDFSFNFFSKLSAFTVTIINNTNHILRMRDARMVYIDPNSDEPVFGLTKEDLVSDFKGKVPVYTELYADILKKYKYTPPETIKSEITKGLTEIVNGIRFINGFNTEILPGMRTTGILVFGVDPEKATEGKVSFIDLISKTDAAGNATEKVRFDFKTELVYKYWKADLETREGIEISEEEYKKGLTNPETYYYDKVQKKYVPGTPPPKK